MKVRARTRYSALRGFAVPLIVIAAALAGPGQAAAQAQVAAVVDPQLPPTPGPVSPEQSNPEAFALIQDAGYAMRYSLVTVAADLSRSYAAGTIEADLKEGLLSLPATKLDPLVAVAKKSATASPNNRVAQFGRHGSLTADQFRALGFSGAFDSVHIDPVALKTAVRNQASKLEREKKAAEAKAKDEARRLNLDWSALTKLKSLDFRIDRVKAVEETDGWGSDEILMGGLQVGPTGATDKVESWMVHDDFDTGEAINYPAPGRLFSNFSLSTSGAWPRSFVSVVMMAEEDSGGFARAVQSAWLKVRGEVGKKIAAAVGDFASEYIGATLGELLGQAIGFLVGAVVDFVISLFGDNIFEARPAAVRIPHPFEIMYNNPAHLGWHNHRLPPTQLRFTGYGGDYRVNVHWQVNS